MFLLGSEIRKLLNNNKYLSLSHCSLWFYTVRPNEITSRCLRLRKTKSPTLFSPTMKYLGIIFTFALHWDVELKRSLDIVLHRASILSMIRGGTSGCHPQTLVQNFYSPGHRLSIHLFLYPNTHVHTKTPPEKTGSSAEKCLDWTAATPGTGPVFFWWTPVLNPSRTDMYEGRLTSTVITS